MLAEGMGNHELKLLLVEDEGSDASLFSMAVGQSGLRILLRCVTDGQGGIEYILGRAPYNNRHAYPLPDGVVLDLRMPNVSGVQFLLWCRKNNLCCRMGIAVLTGAHPEDPEVQRAVDVGAKRIFFKPTNFHDWEQVVRQIDDIGRKKGSTGNPITALAA